MTTTTWDQGFTTVNTKGGWSHTLPLVEYAAVLAFWEGSATFLDCLTLYGGQIRLLRASIESVEAVPGEALLAYNEDTARRNVNQTMREQSLMESDDRTF